MKKLIIILVSFVALILGIYYYNNAPMGVDFSLQATNGKTVTKQDLYAKPSIIFFGFTGCPEVCPTTLYELSLWLDQLGSEADKLNVWFFTVDPERDTIDVLDRFVNNFSTKILGITSTPEKEWAAIKGFGAVWKKVYDNDGDYTINHTSGLFLLNKGGSLFAKINYNEDPKQAIAKIKALLQHNAN